MTPVGVGVPPAPTVPAVPAVPAPAGAAPGSAMPPVADAPPWSSPAVVGASLGIAALILLGLAVPFFDGPGVEPLLADLGESWPVVVLVVVALVAAIDGGRGSVAGLGAVGGVALVLVPFHGVFVRLATLWSSTPGVSAPLGPGFWSWTVAAVVGIPLAAMAVAGSRGDGPDAVPPVVGLGLVVAAGVWTVGIVQPPAWAGSVTDHLFGDDAAMNVITVGLLAGPGVAAVVAAVRRTVRAYGLALGVSLFWLGAWASNMTGADRRATVLDYREGALWAVGIGVVAMVVLAAVGLLVRRGEQPDGTATSTPVPLVAVLALVAAPVLGLVAVVGDGGGSGDDLAGGGDPVGFPADPCAEDPWQCEGGPAVADDFTGDGVPPELQPGGLDDPARPPGSACPTNSSSPELQRYWAGSDGLHVVIVITTTCPTPQVLADREATFGLYAAGQSFVEAGFDFGDDPVFVPASGRSAEIELVFDPITSSTDVTALEAVEVPTSERDAVAVGFDVRYRFVCEPADGTGPGTSRSHRVISRRVASSLGSGAAEAPAAPIDAAPTGELRGDDALRELERIAAADRPHVYAALYDEWVPQLSAKQLGVTDATTGITYDDHGMILDHYRELLARYPDVRLVNSSTYSSFRYAGYWVVVVGRPQGSPEAALRWCSAEGWGRDDCYAKRINHGDYDGNTRLQD